MLSDDEKGLGDFFSTANAEEGEQVVCPIEMMTVDRVQLRCEGKTTAGFTPLFGHFDCTGLDESRLTVELEPLKVYFRTKRHSLWGHKLWNAAKYLVKRIDSRMIDVRGKMVLELGAGLGVPSLAAFRNGARCVVVSDYPDPELLEILEMNVKANCTPDMIDPDAVTFLVEDAQKRKQALLERGCCGNDCGDSSECSGGLAILTDGERQRAVSTLCVVEPLLWGREDHIRQVLSHTGGVGFDIVLLSDILFNHICNDNLVKTLVDVLQNNQLAAAYCVFSHHRAHKQVEDLEFFDKCVARGLRYVQLDEEDYPLMFLEDRGPAKIRQPVKVYKIMRHFDNAGMAFGSRDDAFDVVIQGTGMVESFLSAACARSGMRVLQCDGADDYGGPFRTMTVERLREFIAQSNGNGRGTGDASCENKDNAGAELAFKGVILVDRMDEVCDQRERQRYLLDLLPAHFLKNGEVSQQLASSEMARHLEFCCFSAFVFILPSSDGRFRLQSVPLTRAQVFAADSFSLLQKRRMMKFVKDVEASLAENFHAPTASVGDDPFSKIVLERNRVAAKERKSFFTEELKNYSDMTFSDTIERKYGLSGAALDTVTMLRQLDVCPADIEHSIDLVRQVLTSVGKFGNMAPFIWPLYGASEISQNMCRIAAVWNATLVLCRSIIPRCRWRQAGVIYNTSTQLVEMSNRQRIKAKVVVVPRTLFSSFVLAPSLALCSCGEKTNTTTTTAAAATTRSFGEPNKHDCMGREARFSRVIIIAKSPLMSWTTLRAAGCGEEGELLDNEDTKMSPPLVLALCQTQTGVVVHIHQVGSTAGQAPAGCGSVVVHFTANEWEMNLDELQQFVLHSFVRCADSANTNTSFCLAEDQLLFFASFVVREKQEALRGIIDTRAVKDEDVSETLKAHPYAVKEYQQRQSKQKKFYHGEHDRCCGYIGDISSLVLPVPTLFQSLIDDGAYLRAAREAFDKVVDKLRAHDDSDADNKSKRYVFLERLPEVS